MSMTKLEKEDLNQAIKLSRESLESSDRVEQEMNHLKAQLSDLKSKHREVEGQLTSMSEVMDRLEAVASEQRTRLDTVVEVLTAIGAQNISVDASTSVAAETVKNVAKEIRDNTDE